MVPLKLKITKLNWEKMSQWWRSLKYYNSILKTTTTTTTTSSSTTTKTTTAAAATITTLGAYLPHNISACIRFLWPGHNKPCHAMKSSVEQLKYNK
ncbi:hypothetical protein ElyMa_004420200 [Elysia marginata]|uniref:Uncharacterized protein n=1 Tax=Elysia marginata TaxID=1093978 RepID=A0AAV4HCA0_9GAST|nr:hypothetical protein ElyMa_004420200 [Elysia marginata]